MTLGNPRGRCADSSASRNVITMARNRGLEQGFFQISLHDSCGITHTGRENGKSDAQALKDVVIIANIILIMTLNNGYNFLFWNQK